MPSSITYPDGSTLISTARNPDQMAGIFQTLTAQMLGCDPATDPTAYAKIRVAWVQEGQPAWLIADDVCILRAEEQDADIAHFYDTGGKLVVITPVIEVNGVQPVMNPSGISINGTLLTGPNFTVAINGISATPNMEMTYIRVWRIYWTHYGPDCFDRARAVIDGLRTNWTHDSLAAQQIYLVTDFPRPRYVPELFEGRWWRRTDFYADFNEFVVSGLSVQTIQSAEVLVYKERGLVLDIIAE